MLSEKDSAEFENIVSRLRKEDPSLGRTRHWRWVLVVAGVCLGITGLLLSVSLNNVWLGIASFLVMLFFAVLIKRPLWFDTTKVKKPRTSLQDRASARWEKRRNDPRQK